MIVNQNDHAGRASESGSPCEQLRVLGAECNACQPWPSRHLAEFGDERSLDFDPRLLGLAAAAVALAVRAPVLRVLDAATALARLLP